MYSIIWALLGILIIFAEIPTGLVELLFLGVAALATSLLTLIPGLGQIFWIQPLIWGALSAGSLWFFRKRFPNFFQGKALEEEHFSWSGQKAKVIEEIRPDDPGRISFRGTSWTAVSETETIPVGTEVEILEQEGNRFTVTAEFMEDFPLPLTATLSEPHPSGDPVSKDTPDTQNPASAEENIKTKE